MHVIPAASYVRLKHALSALALDAVRGRPAARAAARRLEAFWLAEGTPDGLRAAPGGPGLHAVPGGRGNAGRGDAGLRRLLRDGLLERSGGSLAFPEGYRPHAAYARRQALRLAGALRALDARPRRRGHRAAVARGAALFDAGLFFECHEFFEEIWRRALPADRAFYQGIILVAAAFYHYEKGTAHGARVKLAEGMKRLRRCPPVHRGVRVDAWLERLEPWMVRVAGGEAGRALAAHEIPTIPLAD
ncbi:MAG: DUF309 domain-containing protein [Armatimonadota bacterium]|nr:DUF309 domain-containing protein [Armatimonadota bacterium]MDR7486371.1 DUF309 domain-containing protein [Armatimonadota bacterium]MDR7532147.1 DUF309 domain-containing protein [Armatimonadota bacterium]MDR7536735.1 DUF309 domain-containing protein [Armatimonadota bacterium]